MLEKQARNSGLYKSEGRHVSHASLLVKLPGKLPLERLVATKRSMLI